MKLCQFRLLYRALLQYIIIIIIIISINIKLKKKCGATHKINIFLSRYFIKITYVK